MKWQFGLAIIIFLLVSALIWQKKRDKPTEQPAPDPKPHEGSGHSDKGNGSKSN